MAWPLWVVGLVCAGVALVWTDKRAAKTKDGVDALGDSDGGNGGSGGADGD